MSRWNPALRLAAAGLALALARPALAEDGPAPATGPAEEEVVLPGVARGPAFRVSGFADFGYAKWLTKGTSWEPFIAPEGAFAVGNMNLYLEGQLSERARSLVEVRFSYLPNGTQSQLVDVDGDGFPDLLQTNGTTATSDPTRQSVAQSAWSGIVVERAHVDYSFSEAFTVRAGQFLTPYGIWNVDHGSPVIIGANRPFVISNQLFPERQVGLELFGARWLGDTRVGWHLTASNGRMDGDPQEDRTSVPQWANYDDRPSFGGRLFVETQAFGELRVGLSFFTGRYTSQVRGFDLATFQPTQRTTIEFDERSAAADVRWTRRGLVLQAEGIYQSVEYTARSGTRAGTTGGRSGAYVLVAHELPHHVMPYVTGQFYNQDHTNADFETWGVEAGIRWSVQPNLVLKGGFSRYVLPRAPAGSLYEDALEGFALQAAWAF